MECSSLKFVDLFAGIGGIRKGFEMACKELGYNSECVLTSEIKESAIKILQQNYPEEKIHGDIRKISAEDIPEFDILLAGFPCQAFSSAGKRLGFGDERGNLFFEIERILRAKKPFGFILENVEGLVTHDKINPKDKIGRTLQIMLDKLKNLGYKVDWRVLNAKNFGIPQDRRRIYILGTLKDAPNTNNFSANQKKLSDVLEKNLPLSNSPLVKLLLSKYSVEELHGKSIKDKRGGNDNIHGWDIEYKGSVTREQKNLLNLMLKERRKKKWAEEFGIDWMDGMPLTLAQIKTFFDCNNLEEILEDLVSKGYLAKESPKRKIDNRRVEDKTLPLGFNIVSGKLSYEISKILDPNDVAPTLVAMDMQHIFVVDGEGLRPLSMREGLRLFGYPDDYKFDISVKEGCDLLGNTVVVPVINEVSKRVIYCMAGGGKS